MQGLGGTGAQQSKDCSFAAGTVSGAPLRVSWFLVIFFIYQLLGHVKLQGAPKWVLVAEVTGNQILLLLTVLCHEMGHGTMARRCGGEIAEVLLWPFGGICFTTRAQGRNSRQKLVDDLWIVGAGPMTHFPQAATWLALLAIFAAFMSDVALPPMWPLIIPFAPNSVATCVSEKPWCFNTYTAYLTHRMLSQAVQTNVMLFMFNVFFPMYPMDGAKIIVCSLQLFCNASARCAAKVLVYTSVPLALLFIGYSLKGMQGGGLQPGITMYMGVMCLAESYKIHKLMREQKLYTHPLFELARSQTRTVNDRHGPTQRLNNDEHDDEEEQRAPQVQFSELRAFGGQGRTLQPITATANTATESSEPLTHDAAALEIDQNSSKKSWLQRLEKDFAEKGKTVRQLEEERLERDRLQREGARQQYKAPSQQ